MDLKRKKAAARQKLLYAVKIGKIIKLSCEYAGCRVGSDKTEAHHFDYDHPLSVMWFCRNHHMDLHTSISIMNNLQAVA